MRPTNVRASVGSSASGSSARPIVSVPPFFERGGVAAEVRGGGGRERTSAERQRARGAR